MEQRRLAVLCSHLLQSNPRPRIPRPGEGSDGIMPVPLSNRERRAEKGAQDPECVFCSIIRGKSPAFKLYEDDTCLCILDSNPLTHGHSLVIPKAHFSTLEATPPSIVAAMCSTIPFLSSAIMKATDSDSFNLLVNNGATAGQVIFHTHLHIIPRKPNDCLWASESVGRKPLKMNQETTSLADSIRQQVLPLVNKFSAQNEQSVRDG